MRERKARMDANEITDPPSLRLCPLAVCGQWCWTLVRLVGNRSVGGLVTIQGTRET